VLGKPQSHAVIRRRNELPNSARRSPQPNGSFFPKQRARERALPAFKRRLKLDRPRFTAARSQHGPSFGTGPLSGRNGRNDRLRVAGLATTSPASSRGRGQPLRAVAPAAPWGLLGGYPRPLSWHYPGRKPLRRHVRSWPELT
jgi:hypothetical protein